MNHKIFLDPGNKWKFHKKRLNAEIELGTCPDISLGTDIEEFLAGYENNFGQKKIKKVKNDSPFKKKSIFFNLPY